MLDPDFVLGWPLHGLHHRDDLVDRAVADRVQGDRLARVPK
ncbi:MAG TPA: hypothetical protein VF756_07025 [Thermoanaerobaculia bacterium]